MKTYEQLKDFYTVTLQPELNALEKKRQSVLRNVLTAGAVVACVIVFFIVSFPRSVAREPGIIIFFVVACLIIYGVVCYYMTRGFVSQFKDRIIRKLVEFIDDNLKYLPSGRIDKYEFTSSKIFKTKPNRYKGDDLVTGTVGDTKIKFSEIHAEYESGSGKNRSRRTVFKGLFFIGDFNKHFHGETVVLPDTAEKLFGSFGKILQSWNKLRGQLIKLEDPEFEKHFVVYGDDQIEARYILSTSLMERIIEFKKKTARKIYLSFVGSRVYVAVSYTKNLFEPRIFRSLLDFSMIQEYYEDLTLAVGIVDDLNLNLRIWTKE